MTRERTQGETMKMDGFIRTMLVAIALLLTVIALRPLFDAGPAVAADRTGLRFGYVQMWAMGYLLPGFPEETHVVLFDQRDGSVWGYSDDALVGKKLPVYVGKLKELGGPIVKEMRQPKPKPQSRPEPEEPTPFKRQ